MAQGQEPTAQKLKWVWTICGLSFFWLFLRRPFFSSLLANLQGYSQECLWLFTLTVVVAAGMLLYFGRTTNTAGKHDRFPILITSIGATGLSTVFVISKEASFALASAAILCLALSFAALACGWVSLLMRKSSRSVLLSCLTSFLLACILSAGFLLPPPVSGLLSAAAPLLSCLCWLFAKSADPLHDRAISEPGNGSRYIPTTFWLLALFLLMSSVLRGLLYDGSVDTLSPQSTIAPSCIAATLSLLFIGAMSRLSKEQRALRYLWQIIVAIFFLGLLLLIVDSPPGIFLGRAAVIASRTCLNVFLLACLCTSGDWATTRPPAFLAAAFLLVDAASSLISYMAVPLFIGFASESFESYITPCAGLICFVLVIVSYGILGKHLFDGQAPAKPEPPDGNSSVEAWGQAYGLSQREQEVVLLLVEGNTVKRMGDLLFVAPSTVQSHMKSIYRKMDVHTRQEVIDLYRHRTETESAD